MTEDTEKSETHLVWHTADEIYHIRKMGTGLWSKDRKATATRLQLLLGYKEALKNRRRWERLDRYEIEEALENELKAIEIWTG